MTTYPIVFQAPDGRRITCYDGEHAAGPWSSGERLLTQAAMDLYCGLTSGSTAGLKRLCHVLDTPHLARVLQAICLLRPDVAHFATHPSGAGSQPEEA